MNLTRDIFQDIATIRDQLSVACESRGVIGRDAAQVLKLGRETRKHGASVAAAVSAGTKLANHFARAAEPEVA